MSKFVVIDRSVREQIKYGQMESSGRVARCLSMICQAYHLDLKVWQVSVDSGTISVMDLKPTFITAQSAADILKRDPRGIALEFTPVAYLQTPRGVKLLYLRDEVLKSAVPEKED
jgi:hypothetical protein